MAIQVVENTKSLDIFVSKAFFEKVAIFAAAYKLTRDFVVNIEPAPDNCVKISIQPISPASNDLSYAATNFRNNLIDEQLRLELEHNYGGIRELIVKHAFAPLENLSGEVKKIAGRE
ncbi:His-Xaa-Ser system protein HxsD [Desulfomonile tiedjei]|uniref:Radical SAM pair-associated protein n=1 Tax=Desulfomonile tiedjei (strain ATCC 49306 / DSM 6799 / DCB-1) TaxID=706587 RepID=I4CDT4_DESTA|nr:His-Xaa-Ser system protein HxsD [Desulfomonile tiedjei]AFM27725.1 radical SAM pair-associated protein [Desulfomonile tiedjei DSM 6799]